MKTVLSRMTPRQILFVSISVVLIFASVVADLMQPFIFSKINNLIGQASGSVPPSGISEAIKAIFPEVGRYLGIMIGAAFGGIVCNIVAILISINVSINISTKLRIETYSKIQYLSLQDVEKFSTSSLISRLNSDIYQVQSMLITLFNILIKTPFYIIGGFGLSIWQIVNLSQGPNAVEGTGYIAFAYLLVPVMLVIAGICGKKASRYFDFSRKYFDQNNKVMIENLKGSRIVRAFNLEENQSKRYTEVNENLKKYSVKSEVIISAIMPVIMLLANISLALVIIIAGYASMNINGGNPAELGIPLPPEALKVVNQTSNIISTVTAFTQYFSMILLGFMLTSMGMYFVVKGKVSSDRVATVLKTESSIKESENPFDFKKGSIEFKNVSFRYNKEGEKPVLDNVSFKVPAGKSIGIIGETGSGKSTLVNLIPRMFDVIEGEVLVSDKNVKELKISHLKKNISFAFQEKILFKGTIKSNVLVGKQDATDEEIINALKMSEAYDFVSKKDGELEAVVEQRGSNFSGGQKQRLSIARALISQPKILIFDDSTSALDNITEKKLLTNIKKNLKNTTLVMVAQRVKSIQDLDQIIVLDQGKIIGQGTHKELLKSCSVYKKIYDSQNTEVGG